MLFKAHYALMMAGYTASLPLFGVYISTYTDASPVSIGALFTLMPLMGIVARPLIGSMADRRVAHREYLIACMLIIGLCNVPFIVIPILGPGVYKSHPRICWFIFLSLKMLSDVSINGIISLTGALAMNYSRRIGVEFTVFRMWGTISWMVSGVLIGQINETNFLPKYTPGFIVLVVSALMDATLLYMWPKEYFRMLPSSDKTEEKKTDKDEPFYADQMKSLMSSAEIIESMKVKLRKIFSCQDKEYDQKVDIELEPKTIKNPAKAKMATPIEARIKPKSRSINKMDQLKILSLLLRRDPRVLLYMTHFLLAGFINSPFGFFYMGLSDLCQMEGVNFSQLAGFLQISMCICETAVYIWSKSLKKRLNRINLCTLMVMTCGIEYLIYYKLWFLMNPRYFLATATLRGFYFAINVVMMMEVAYIFANEVEFLLPELKAKKMLSGVSGIKAEQLKLSLAATMQALIGIAYDGLGRGSGSLVAGILVSKYSYTHLWLTIASVAMAGTLVLVLVSILDKMVKFDFGLDQKTKLATDEARWSESTKV